MTEVLRYTVARGKNAGTILVTHRYDQGYFQAHRTNSRNDPEGKRVTTEVELISLVRSGYHVRMSNIAKGHAPSTSGGGIVATIGIEQDEMNWNVFGFREFESSRKSTTSQDLELDDHHFGIESGLGAK